MNNLTEPWMLERWRKNEPLPIRIGYGKYKGSVGLFPARYFNLGKARGRSHEWYYNGRSAWLEFKPQYNKFRIKILDKEITIGAGGTVWWHSDFVENGKPKLKIAKTKPKDTVDFLVDRLGNEIRVGSNVAVCFANKLQAGVVTRLGAKVMVRIHGRKTAAGLSRVKGDKVNAPKGIILLHKAMFDQMLIEKLSTK